MTEMAVAECFVRLRGSDSADHLHAERTRSTAKRAVAHCSLDVHGDATTQCEEIQLSSEDCR